MSTLYDQLVTLRDRFGAIPGVATSRIGIEPTISPEDYPIVRIVPQKATAAGRQRESIVQVFFGLQLYESDVGLESVYERLLGLEEAVIAALDGNGFSCAYVRTIYDEDMIEHYKLMAVEAKIAIFPTRPADGVC